MVIPGEDSRNKQLREIQLLLSSAPIVLPLEDRNSKSETRTSVANSNQPVPESESNFDFRVSSNEHQSPARPDSVGVTNHQPAPSLSRLHTLVLPSVPVDQLLDDHAVEFEECKRWANSEAGQAAHMTNPAGFANVRAHAEAHLRAMAQAAMPANPATAPAPAAALNETKGQ